MLSEIYLNRIQELLEEGRAGEASDLLSELLLNVFNKPTTIKLPSNISQMSPDEAFRAVSAAFQKLKSSLRPSSSIHEYEDDMGKDDYRLIEETSLTIDTRQQVYTPDEELMTLSDSSPTLKFHPTIEGFETRPHERPSPDTVRSYGEPSAVDVPDVDSESEGQTLSEQDEEEWDDFPMAKSNPDDFLIDNDDFVLVSDLDDKASEQVSTIVENKMSTDEDWLLDETFFEDEDDGGLLEEVEIDAPVERSSRAWQVAYDLGSRFGWDDNEISLLQEVFVERGWQQAKVAMEYLLQKGMTSEQLFFAKQLKALWIERTDLMIAFYRYSKDASNYCYLGEQILSWRTAIDIIKKFDGCCGFEEIELFVEEALDAWYGNRHLRKSYRTFLQYLRSVSEREGHLSANLFDFDSGEDLYGAFRDTSLHDLRCEYPDIYYLNSWQPELWRKTFE